MRPRHYQEKESVGKKSPLDSFSALSFPKLMPVKVRMPGLEPGTSSLSVMRSNQLSYTRALTIININF